MPVRIRLLCGVVCCFLSGCFSDTVEDDFATYRQRLGNVLDTNLPAATAYQIAYPSRASLYLPVSAFDINLTEFQTLQSCAVGTAIAERNTVLGKQQELAALYSYERTLLNGLDDCIEKIRTTSPELADKLVELKQQKEVQQPRYWANMVQSAEEVRLNWSLSNDWLQAANNKDATAAINALAYLAHLPSDSQVTLSELNQQLNIIGSARLHAKMWRTQSLFGAQLTSLTDALQAPLAAVDCSDGRASEQAEILRNVFYLYFIEKLQPVGSTLNHYQYQLQPVWDTLMTAPALSPDFQQFINANAVVGFTRYQQAVNEHVKLWQTFLARCHLSPQKS